jgi:pimeloyl-ACP methyl ester carboxylesterase
VGEPRAELVQPQWVSILPSERFIVPGITDIKEEIALVASTLSAPPIVIAHSMGGMAAQKFAEENDLRVIRDWLTVNCL